MSKKSIKKNYLYNVCYQILVLLTPLITTPYISRVLGADGVGTASYIQSIVSYFTLFATMGMTTFGQREISYVQDNREKRTQIFWETKVLEFITTTVAVVLYIIFSLHQKNSELYFILVFHIFSVFTNVTWFFQGLEEFGKIILRNIIFKCINIAYIFLFIKEKEDLIWYLFGVSFFTVLSDISLWAYLPKWIGKPIWKELKPFRHVGVILSLFLPTIAIQVYTVLDKTMIGVITQNASENGYYEQAIKISKMVLTIVTSLGTVMVPRIGHHYGAGNQTEIERLLYRSYHFVWFLGIPLCLGLIMCAENFVPWFFGEGYDKVVPLLRILSLLIIAIGLSNVTGTQYLMPTKRQKKYTVAVITGAVVNFGMNIILIPKFASIGAAVASVVAEFVVTVVQIGFVRRELKPSKILKEGLPYYVAGAVMAMVLFMLANSLTPSVEHTFLLIMTGVIVYVVMLFLLKDEFLISNANSVLRKFLKK